MIISLPAIFRGLDLDPLQPANVSYLLWMLMGYLVVSAVLVVTLGRLPRRWRPLTRCLLAPAETAARRQE